MKLGGMKVKRNETKYSFMMRVTLGETGWDEGENEDKSGWH